MSCARALAASTARPTELASTSRGSTRALRAPSVRAAALPRRRVAVAARSDRHTRASPEERHGSAHWAPAPRGMGFFDDDAPGVSSSMTLMSNPAAAVAPLFLLADGLRDDIKPSYFATLGLFVLSAPGLWSLVKRSAKSKIDRKTFEVAGPSAEQAMPLDELAREISMHFRRNNYEIAEAGEVITFEGNIAPEKGTAAYITFCVAIGLLCIALVCSIALPGGNLWYALASISPLSGSYYMENAGRKEQVKVKMVTADDDMTTDVIVEGDVEEIERMRRDLNLTPKGLIRVKGILEKDDAEK